MSSDAWSRPGPRPARQGVWLAAGVLLLHLLVGALALRLTVWRDRAPPARTTAQAPVQAPVLLWWPQARPVVRAPATAAPQAPTTAVRQPARPAEPQAITPPAAEAPPPALQSAPSAPSVTTPATPAAPPPLNLALPRGASAPWRQHPAALDDALTQTAPRTLESRLAAAIGGVGDQVVEERLDDGRLRLRRGTSCVIVHPSRAGRIDPFNESFSPKARGVERC